MAATDRRQEWERLAALLDHVDSGGGLRSLTAAELREFSRLYRSASSDLSLARSRGRTDVADYLNQLLGRAHNRLYVRRSGRRSRPAEFFGSTIPATFKQCLPYWLFALGLLLLSMTVGWVATAHNPAWADSLAGEGMRGQMETFLKSGESPGQYFQSASESLGSGGLSGFLMTNNIQVALMCFAFGIAWGLGTVFVLVRNGLMLGAALGLGAYNGKLMLMVAVVAPHGVVELSAVVVASAAGLRLGYALINPGDYTRRDALVVAARQAGQLALGTIPMFIFAGLVEGIISPVSTGLLGEDYIRIIFGVFSGLALYLWLFGGDLMMDVLAATVRSRGSSASPTKSWLEAPPT